MNNRSNESVEEINLYDLLKFYAKNWLNIVTALLISAIIGVAYTYFVQTPKYESKATLIAVGVQHSGTQDSVTLNNYVQLFTSHRVLDSVISDQDYKPGYDSLVSGMAAQNVKNTDIINVSISTADPKTSKTLLEGAIQSFRLAAKQLYGDSTIKINLVDGASTPSQPSNISPVKQIGLAMAAGLALMIVALFFVYDYRNSQPAKKVAATTKVATAAMPKAKKAKTSAKKTTQKRSVSTKK